MESYTYISLLLLVMVTPLIVKSAWLNEGSFISMLTKIIIHYIFSHCSRWGRCLFKVQHKVIMHVLGPLNKIFHDQMREWTYIQYIA